MGKVLRVLFMGNCKVSSEKEFQKLAELPNLEELVFFGNPLQKAIVDKEGELGWPKYVLTVLPNLRKLDGITMVEWQQKMSGGNGAELKELFDKIDADGNGEVSVKELKEALKDEEVQAHLKLTAAKVDETFKQIDTDGSGALSWEEFEKYFNAS